MKSLILLATFLTVLPSCTTPPPITGEFATNDGVIKVHPDGRIELTVQPRSSK